ncbi:MAG: hypothetical protein ACI9OJ_005581 [Myxococcota bacterium]|jgi:hypothetical protein
MTRFALRLIGIVGFLAACGGAGGGHQIEVVSSKAYLVSGGNALVRVHAPVGTAITLNGRAISDAFRRSGDSLLGLVEGLSAGPNTLAVGATELELTNYPATGPMISGPHEVPYICGTAEANVALSGESLGEPLDEDCSAATRVDYVYLSTDGEFHPLPDGDRPGDIAKTTTMDGTTVPFIVRVETGTINRAIYESALLHDPNDPKPDPWTRSAGWNGKLIYTHGGGCQSGWHVQGSRTGGVLHQWLLQDGYAVTSSSLNVYGQNCNDLLASETHMMVKEQFIERYGPLLYTIGTGCSGGSYQSHQTADNYPGVFDGIIVSCSFPDVISATGATVADTRLLHYYFEQMAPGTFTKDQQKAVAGFREWANVPGLSRSAERIDPVFDESVAAEEQGGGVQDIEALRAARYDPVGNPEGFRPTIYEHAGNVYGRDPNTGFAGRPLDNVGIQYGLAALNEGAISVGQFLDLNEKIGGYDADANHVPQRHVADPHAARMARASGRILYGGGGLATTPVIDFRTYTDDREGGDIHMVIHQFSTRARMLAANGHTDNHVMLLGGRWGFTEEQPDQRRLFRQMDAWLSAIAADSSNTDQGAKVANSKPADLTEGCWDDRSEPRQWIEQPLTAEGSGVCQELYPAFRTPRLVAGAPLASNVVTCQLKPIASDDYQVELTASDLSRLASIFPEGVCDWAQPGQYAGYQGTWRSFGPSPVNRVE